MITIRNCVNKLVGQGPAGVLTAVTVRFQGRGHNVKAYVLGPKELKTLLAATVEDALYEDNPYSLVGNLCAQAETVTLGFDPSRTQHFRCRVESGGGAVEVEDLVYDNGDDDALEAFDPMTQLVVREDVKIALGGERFAGLAALVPRIDAATDQIACLARAGVLHLELQPIDAANSVQTGLAEAPHECGGEFWRFSGHGVSICMPSDPT